MVIFHSPHVPQFQAAKTEADTKLAAAKANPTSTTINDFKTAANDECDALKTQKAKQKEKNFATKLVAFAQEDFDDAGCSGTCPAIPGSTHS